MTGKNRMGKKGAYDLRKVSGPPEGKPWCWLTVELLTSAAWTGQSIHCRRLLDFLMLEHMAHAGTENGNLAAPYSQLVGFGIGRRFIAMAIREAEDRRLIEVIRGGKRNQVADHISRYRLTWLATKARDQTGTYYVAPTNDWTRTTKADVEAILVDRKKRLKRRSVKKQSSGAPGVNRFGAPEVNSLGVPGVNLNGGKLPLRSVHYG